MLSIVAASFITTTIQVLLAVAGLEFLGFGDSATVSWGTMLYEASNSSAPRSQGAWWWFAPPGLCIALLGCGLALLNFGIDEIADPRLRQSRRTCGPHARGTVWPAETRNRPARAAEGASDDEQPSHCSKSSISA